MTGALANPTLELYDQSGALIASNDDWQQSPQVNEIIASTIAPSNARESAIVATLPAGGYTTILRGVSGTTGVALVEGYELDSNSSRLVNISTRGRVGVGSEVLIGGFIVRGTTAKKSSSARSGLSRFRSKPDRRNARQSLSGVARRLGQRLGRE